MFLAARRVSAAPFGVNSDVRKPERGAYRLSSLLHRHTAESFRRRIIKSVARAVILRFGSGMRGAINADSKLSAWDTRHAKDGGLVPPLSFAPTWQGGEKPLRCILPCAAQRHADTVPVSALSGLRSDARLSFEVRL